MRQRLGVVLRVARHEMGKPFFPKQPRFLQRAYLIEGCVIQKGARQSEVPCCTECGAGGAYSRSTFQLQNGEQPARRAAVSLVVKVQRYGR